jgi:NADH:ubiquinone oxidoreductase 27 kD subunit
MNYPKFSSNEGVIDAAKAALGDALIEAVEKVGEIQLHVRREATVDALRALRDTPGLEYQQLMEIAGVDYPDRG